MYRDIVASNSPWLSVAFIFTAVAVFVPPRWIHGNHVRQRRDFNACKNGPIVASNTVRMQMMLLVAWQLLSIIGRWNQVVAAYVYLHKSWQTKRGICNDSFSPWSWNDVKWWLFLHSTMAIQDHEKLLIWYEVMFWSKKLAFVSQSPQWNCACMNKFIHPAPTTIFLTWLHRKSF